MKKVYLLILVSLVLLLAFTACTAKHEHEFASATCESPATCSCGETQGEALGHDLTAATCTTPATCKTCGAVDGTALGHNWADATCTAPKTCLTCNETEGTPAGHKNDIVLNGKDATCSATGLTEGTKCSACGTVTKEQEVIEKLAHTPEILEAKESTCSETGLTAGEQCSVCKEVLVAQQITDKKAHTEEVVPGYAASCKAPGLTDGKKCSVCGTTTVEQKPIEILEHTPETLKGYAATCTEDGKTDGVWCKVCETILDPQTVLVAPGHDMTDPTCTEDAQCKNCDFYEVESAYGHELRAFEEGYAADYNPATCQYPGSYNWVVGCWNCDYEEKTLITVDSEKNPQGYDLAQLSHVYTTYVYNGDATCYADGTETAVCDLCKDFAEPATDTRISVGSQRAHKDDDRKCGEPFVCEYEDCDYEDPTPLAHTMVDATCKAYAYCSKCDFVDEAAGYADHTPGEAVVENDVPAQCLVDGSYDEVTYCTVCSKECSRVAKVHPALGHAMADATCDKPSTCTRCGHEEGEARTSHKLEMSYEDDTLVYYCSTCDDRSFSVDTQKFVFDGSNHNNMTGASNNNKYTTESGTEQPKIVTDANGNKYYQMLKLTDTTGNCTAEEQSQIWLPYHCDSAKHPNTKHFTELKEGATAVLGFDINYGMNQNFQIFLVEGRYDGSWGSTEGRINDKLIEITNLQEKTVDGQTVKYVNVKGWNGVLLASYEFKADDILSAYGATGWFNISVGLEVKHDYVTAHYYIDGEYVTSTANALTTRNNSITTAYINAYTQDKDSGYLLDNLVFGYTKDAEWIFDACDHANKTSKVTAPGCETQGYTTYTCPDCKLVWNDNYTDPTDHNTVNVEAQAPTCSAEGWNAYSYCANCGDADAAKAAALLEKVAHTPADTSVADETSRVPVKCNINGSHDEVIYCTECNAELSRETVVDVAPEHLNLQVVKGYDSTCYATGLTDGEECLSCGTKTQAQETIAKKAHTPVEYGGFVSTEPCKTPSITAGVKCSVEGCGAIITEPVTQSLAPHTYDGNSDMDCNVCGDVRTCLHETTEIIPADPATCLKAGSTAGEKCSNCGAIIVQPQVDPQKDHLNDITLEAKDATCTETGLTEGKQCSACDTVTKAQEETPALGHVNTTELPKVDPTCTTAGKTAGVACTRCGTVTTAQVEIPAPGHDWADATCDAPATCKVCFVTTGEAVATHTLSYALNSDNKIVYSCANCTRTFTTATKSYYLDGTGYDGMYANDPKNDKYYDTDNTAISSQYLPKRVTEGDNTYYALINDNGTERGQGQLWVPSYWNATGHLTDFSAANKSVAFLSFDINAAIDLGDGLNVVFAMGDPDGTGPKSWWTDNTGYINSVLFLSKPDENNVVTLKGLGTQLKTFQVSDDDKFTGWFNVQMGLVFDPVNDQFIVHYYVDGEYVTSVGIEMTLVGDFITGIQFNFYTKEKNYGLKLDNIAFGYENNSQWIFDECAHQYGEATTVSPTCLNKGYDESKCALCGHAKRSNYVDATGHDATPSCYEAVNCGVCGEKAYDALGHDIKTSYNGKLVYSCERCSDFSLPIDTGYYLDGSNYNGMMGVANNNKTHGYTTDASGLPAIVDGKYVFSKDTSVFADYGQLQIYVPNSASYNTFTNFTTADNALGVLSFKINAKLDTGMLRFIIRNMAARNANPRIEPNEFTLFQLNKPGTDGTMRIDGWGKTGLKTITLQDGWTGELDVMIAIQLTDDGKMKVFYYMNGELLDTAEGDLPLADGLINALYVTANSTGEGTGYVLDDLAFGYTTNAHWTFDGQKHNITPAASCSVPETCTCGWTGATSEHNYVESTCFAPSTCSACGDKIGEYGIHKNVEQTLVDGKVAYQCTDCNTIYTNTTQQFYFDGSTHYTEMNPSQLNGKYTTVEGTDKPIIATDENGNSYYQFVKLNDTTGTRSSTEQAQVWIPYHCNDTSSKTAHFLEFKEGASGVVSLDLNYGMDQRFEFYLCEGAPSNGTSWYDGSGLGRINKHLIYIDGIQNNTITVTGWNGIVLGTYELKADETLTKYGATGWFNITVGLTIANDKVTAYYYVDGKYIGTESVELTTEKNSITTAYINAYTAKANSGMLIDNLSFGYDRTGHYTLDGQTHVVTPGNGCATPDSCSCGWVGELTANHSVTATNADGKLTYSCANCTRTYVLEDYYFDNGFFSGITDNYNRGFTSNENGLPEVDSDGVYSFIRKEGYASQSAQYQMWLPSNGKHNNLAGFTAANNAYGIFGFSMSANIDSTSRFLLVDSDYRSNGLGNWDKRPGDIVQLVPSGNNIIIKDLSGGTVATIAKGADGWTEWFDLKVIIHFSVVDGVNTLELSYYYNDNFVRTIVKDMTGLTDRANSIYMTANTSAVGTGIKFKNYAFGYTTNGHWTLDNNIHEWIVSEATCASGLKCSCGWETAPLLHDNLVFSAVDGDAKYTCADCNASYATTGYYYDGTAKDYNGGSTNGGYHFADNGATNNSVAEGYYDYTVNSSWTESPTSYQLQLWIPGQTDASAANLEGFTCANNAEGFLSFRIKFADTFVDGTELWLVFGEPRNTTGFVWGTHVDKDSGTLKIAKSGNNAIVKDISGNTIATMAIPEDGWVEFTAHIYLYKSGDNNMIRFDIYLGGEYKTTYEKVYNVVSGKLTAVHIKTGLDTKDKSVYIDDIAIGYIANED